MSRTLFVFSLLLAVPAPVLADVCRDGRGEPIPCPSSPPEVGVPPTAPPSRPSTEPAPPSSSVPSPFASVTFDLSGESLDLRPLHFTPSEPDDVADLARDTTIAGSAAPVDVPAMTFGFEFASRPLPWLELPILRLAWGFGTPDASVPVLNEGGRTAELGTLMILRMEIGAGFDVPIADVMSIFARGHVALAGYFLSARVVDETYGSLGRTWLAEDAWEAGWTVGMAVNIERHTRWSVSYRHIHTGAESHVVTMGFTADLD